MPTKKASRKKADATPKTLAEAAALERSLGELIKQYRQLEDDRDSAIATLKAEFEQTVAPIKKKAAGLAKQIYAYAKKHRGALTTDNAPQTAIIAEAGLVEWHTNPFKAIIKDEKEVLARLVQADRFVRWTLTIDKQTILSTQKNRTDANKFDGISVTQSQSVYIKPHGAHGHVEVTIGPSGRLGKWRIKFPEKEVEV